MYDAANRLIMLYRLSLTGKAFMDQWRPSWPHQIGTCARLPHTPPPGNAPGVIIQELELTVTAAVRRILLIGSTAQAGHLRKLMEESNPGALVMDVVGTDVADLVAGRAPGDVVVFVDPGTDGDQDAVHEEWRSFASAVADMSVAADSDELPRALADRLAASDSGGETTEDTVHRLAWQWADFGFDPEPIELVALLKRTSEHVRRGADAVLASHNLTRELFDILAALYRARDEQHLTQAQLAAQMFITQAGMLKRLRKLQRLGFIERNIDPTDARKQTVSLTDPGRVVLESVLDEFFAAERRSLDTLNGPQRIELTRMLRELLNQHDD